MSCDYCTGDCPHDSRDEAVIDWYEEYLAMRPMDVVEIAISQLVHDELSAPIKCALEARSDEIDNAVADARYLHNEENHR